MLLLLFKANYKLSIIIESIFCTGEREWSGSEQDRVRNSRGCPKKEKEKRQKRCITKILRFRFYILKSDENLLPSIMCRHKLTISKN